MSVFRHQMCLLCHEPVDKLSEFSCLCAACAQDLTVLYHDTTDKCPICAKKSVGNAVCGACQKEAPIVNKLWASLHYQFPIPALLHEFKHVQHIAYGQLLAELMLANPPLWLPETKIDGVLAMPMSTKRRVFRGFNQCDELARWITQHYHLPLLPIDTVQRQHRPPQSTLKKATERKANIRAAFCVHHNVKNRKILIIEDLMTTGSTIFELARTLRKSGVNEIYVWLLARNL
ncbi:MAG: ComF family protein [Neisseriaceae bacterium]|nr:ComF family protein [Neisseriaceae bacterium]